MRREFRAILPSLPGLAYRSYRSSEHILSGSERKKKNFALSVCHSATLKGAGGEWVGILRISRHLHILSEIEHGAGAGTNL